MKLRYAKFIYFLGFTMVAALAIGFAKYKDSNKVELQKNKKTISAVPSNNRGRFLASVKSGDDKKIDFIKNQISTIRDKVRKNKKNGLGSNFFQNEIANAISRGQSQGINLSEAELVRGSNSDILSMMIENEPYTKSADGKKVYSNESLSRISNNLTQYGSQYLKDLSEMIHDDVGPDGEFYDAEENILLNIGPSTVEYLLNNGAINPQDLPRNLVTEDGFKDDPGFKRIFENYNVNEYTETEHPAHHSGGKRKVDNSEVKPQSNTQPQSINELFVNSQGKPSKNIEGTCLAFLNSSLNSLDINSFERGKRFCQEFDRVLRINVTRENAKGSSGVKKYSFDIDNCVLDFNIKYLFGEIVSYDLRSDFANKSKSQKADFTNINLTPRVKLSSGNYFTDGDGSKSVSMWDVFTAAGDFCTDVIVAERSKLSDLENSNTNFKNLRLHSYLSLFRSDEHSALTTIQKQRGDVTPADELSSGSN